MIKYPLIFNKVFKHSQNNKNILLIISIVIVACVFIFQMAYGLMAEPGSNEDPVITLSYLQEIFMPSVKQEINLKINNMNTNEENSFKVVSIKVGQQLIGNAGTEMILRMGQATVISSEKGGLADTTQGEDLHNGVNIPPNHLLIIPMDDGRGLIANTELLVMVKGKYNIK